jgi:heme oxygenase (mycobilin-producing)
MSVVVIADFFFKPELIDDALKLLAQVLPDTRHFDGCQALETAVDLDDPGHVMLVERWTSRDAHLAYFVWRQESGSASGLLDRFRQRLRFGTSSLVPTSELRQARATGHLGKWAEHGSRDGGLANPAWERLRYRPGDRRCVRVRIPRPVITSCSVADRRLDDASVRSSGRVMLDAASMTRPRSRQPAGAPHDGAAPWLDDALVGPTRARLYRDSHA